MTTYKAPIRDALYSLLDLHGFAQHYASLVPVAGLDAGTLSAILEVMGQFAERELVPLNASGDLAGAHWAAGRSRPCSRVPHRSNWRCSCPSW